MPFGCLAAYAARQVQPQHPPAQTHARGARPPLRNAFADDPPGTDPSLSALSTTCRLQTHRQDVAGRPRRHAGRDGAGQRRPGLAVVALPVGGRARAAVPRQSNWDRFRALPTVRAALDALPDPVSGLLIYSGPCNAALYGNDREGSAAGVGCQVRGARASSSLSRHAAVARSRIETYKGEKNSNEDESPQDRDEEVRDTKLTHASPIIRLRN